MIAARRIATGASLVGLAATALLTWSVPAQAAPDMACDSGAGIACSTFNSAYGERWYINDAPYPAGDDQSDIAFSCRRGSTVGVLVTYINTSGNQETVGTSAYCGFVLQ